MLQSPDRRAVVGLVVLAAVVVAGLLVSPERALGVAAALRADPVLFGALLAALYLVRPALAWPTTLLAVLAGYGFGLWGIPVALLGAGLTALPTYGATRWFGGDSRLVDRVGERTERYFQSTGDFRGVVAARLAPIPADAVTCVAAVSGVSAGTVFLGTVVGEIPWTVGAVLVGSSAERLTTAGLDAVGLPVVAAALGGACLLLAGPAYRTLVTESGV